MMQHASVSNPVRTIETIGLAKGRISGRSPAQAIGSHLLRCLCTLLALLLGTGPTSLSAQGTASTGSQQLAFDGLRSVNDQGQINAVCTGAAGNIYLLIDQKDGVRLLKTDATATNILAQTQIGAKGDIGVAMALDPAGNVYVTGTTTSGTLAATSGAAFPSPSGNSTNSFVAKFDSNLNTVFVSFAGGGFMAATAIAATSDAVFITGSIFSTTLPVTPGGIQQTPAPGNSQSGFVEKFSASGSTLLYATYLTGANGNTAPAAIAADSSDDAYIAGYTSATGYPTTAALVPEMLGTASGFLTRLTPEGDGITFSTFIPGAGVTSLAIDPSTQNLLLSGSIALGQFPVMNAAGPLVATQYQVAVRMPLDGSNVLASTVVAPGTQSFITPGSGGEAWVDGTLSLPLLPLAPLSGIGNSFAARVNATGVVDQTARLGGIATTNPGNAGAPINVTSIATDPNGQPLIGGAFAPYASQNLLATETFDLPLASSPTAAFPSTIRSAVLPASACDGSLCAGSAAYLAKLATPASPAASLALSVDDSPNIGLGNLGSAQAANLQIAVTGFTSASNCGTTLAASGSCNIELSGSGPGTITVSATNATSQTAALPALAPGTTALPIVFSPRELDFGIVSSASGPILRTITVTNLTQQSQAFSSMLDANPHTTTPYTLVQQSADCTVSGASMLLAPSGVCHITLAFTASSSPADDGPVHANWLVGLRDAQIAAFAQAAALSLSSTEIDFGTEYTTGPHLARYLYLSNNSTTPISHANVSLPSGSPFAITDLCPTVLEPETVCQLQLAYRATQIPSADSVTLSLDQGLTVLVTGRTLAPPAVNGASVNPSLSVSATSLIFANPVVVTGTSSGTQSLTVSNTGASAFSLALALTGDFADSTNCGAILAGGASCSVVVTFAPSAPGTRQGLLALTAGAGTTPQYVTLSGTGTGILSPANNGTLNFGSVIAGQPSVAWFKITQSFTSLSATVGGASPGAPFGIVLVEDIGYGHGQPPSTAFSATASGACYNCWLGVQFTPASTGLQTAALSLSSGSGGSPYSLSLSGSGLPLTGLLLTPLQQDFGPVPVNSTGGAALFTLTNLLPGGNSISLASPALTGDFALSNQSSAGAVCGGALAYTASCLIEIDFTPTATGQRTGTLTVQGGGATTTASLTGYGETDPGLALNPTALTFSNVPGTSATQQTIGLANTGTGYLQIGAPSSNSANFSAASSCGTLAPGSACSIVVSFTHAAGPSAGTLTIPVTSTVGGAPIVTPYTVDLTGAYTTEDAGLQIVPGQAEYGPQAVGTLGVTRQFTINNLTAKSLTLNIALPRQFVLSGPPCSGLAPNASCNFQVSFLPLTNEDITGTLFAQATPTDGSATLNGIGYVEGYGSGAASLAITGGLLPGSLLNFRQVPSGQSTQKTLTLTNTSTSAPLTIRRITSEWPFLSTTTCGAALAPAATCTVTLSYTPLNQVATGTPSPPSLTDSGALVIESDAVSSPDLIDLTGSSTPVTLTSPSNTAPLAAFVPSQNSLTFPDTRIGDASTPQTVTLANTGSATLHILSLRTTADYTSSSDCSTLLPGASCNLIVTFTPQNSATLPASGNRIGTVEISSDASTSLEFLSLIGASQPSTLALAQTTLDFGTVQVGASSTLSLQASNNGPTSAAFSGISATGDYTVANGTCPAPGGTLGPATSCSAQVTFTPTQSGTRTGTFSLTSSATTLPLTVALTGVGAQSHLQVAPSTLSFGSIALGAPANLTLTLTNAGNAPVTGLSLAATGDYVLTAPCPSATLLPAASCTATLTFTPSAVGARPGTLTITSSDSSSPDTVPLTGTGVANGSFTFTVGGSSGGATTGSASVISGFPATYTLTVTPQNNFAGTVVFNCTPITAGPYASCSILPSSITLSGPAQRTIATINTVTSVALSSNVPPGMAPRSFGDTVLCLLFPAFIFTWKARTSRHRAWRKVGPIAWALFASIALLSSGGCGGGATTKAVTDPNLRYTPPGTYQYQVTASSVSGGAQLTQTVTLNLTVQ